MVGIPLNQPNINPQELIAELLKTISNLYLEISILRLENEKFKKIMSVQAQEQTN
jgi:hypothetical protein